MPRARFSSRLLNLKSLIVFLAFFVALITLVNGFYASYKVQRNQLFAQTLDTNQAYAQKLAAATDNFIQSAHEQLTFAAAILGNSFADKALLQREAERLHLQTKSFNSVAVTNAQGEVLATSPNTLGLVGSLLTAGGAPEALQAKAPLVSAPYLSVSGNYLVLISAPIFSPSGEYLGYIGGSIYLKKRSILNDLLGEHYHKDGSYIYVLDKNRQFLYHPDPERVGQHTDGNIATLSLQDNTSGSVHSKNSLGIDMLAGFAPIKTTGWRIVAQRPVTATLNSLDDLMKNVIYRTLPLALFTFVCIWFLASFISRPLRQLADTAARIDTPDARTNLSKIKSWYFEVHELRQAMLKGLGIVNNQISQLKQDAATDPLTGALNRRSLQLLLEQLEQKNIPFSVLAVDIDHFKRVNDTFGHAAGDTALVELTQVMHQVSREQDIVARTGGEEFLLILPNTPLNIVQIIAERIRSRVEHLHIEPIGSINVSIGIASQSCHNQPTEDVLAQADQALYQAKNQGRNRCVVFVAPESTG